MATMNVSLPDQMKEWIEAQVRSGRYANVSDFVRDLVRDAQDRQAALEEFDRLVVEAEAGGTSPRSAADILAAAREEARARGLT